MLYVGVGRPQLQIAQGKVCVLAGSQETFLRIQLVAFF